MGVDKRGVDRGICKESHCTCTDFKPSSSHKCSCGHLPTAHMAVSQPLPGRTGASPKTGRRTLISSGPDPAQSWSSVVAGLAKNFSSHSISQCQHYGKHHYDNGYHGNYSRSPTTVRQQYHAGKLCENDCGRPCYYDDELGEFKYCSGQCRDNHYLPKYKKKLSEALEEEKRQMLHSSESPRPPSGSKPSPRPPSGSKQPSPRLPSGPKPSSPQPPSGSKPSSQRPSSGSKQPSPRPPSGPKPSTPQFRHHHKIGYS